MENANSIFIIEMIAVCTFALTGVLFQFHAWPHPLFLLIWAGVIFVGFSLYRGAAYAHRRFMPTATEAIGAGISGTQAPAAEASARAWSANDPSEVDPTVMQPAVLQPAADMAHPPLDILALSAAFEAAELRQETHLDLVEPDAGPLPAFAESTLTVKQREQTLRTLLKDIGELKDPRVPAPEPVESGVEAPGSPIESRKPEEHEDMRATLLQPRNERPAEDAPRQPDPSEDATLLKPLDALPIKDLSGRSDPAEDATLLQPLDALPIKDLSRADLSSANLSRKAALARSGQIGRRVQFLDGDALDELRRRAAKLDPPLPAKDDE